MSHTMKQRAAADVVTPSAGRATVFVDTADGEVKAKLPNGSVTGGPSGAAVGTVIATIVLLGSNGNVENSTGTGISEGSRVSTGVYLFRIAVTGTQFSFVPIIGVRSDAMRSATCKFEPNELEESGMYQNLIVRVWDHAGAAADCDYLYVAIMTS